MSRIALSSVERAQREVLPLDLALYHAARDYPGGAAASAAPSPESGGYAAPETHAPPLPPPPAEMRPRCSTSCPQPTPATL